MNADAPIIATFSDSSSLRERVAAVDTMVTERTGFEVSAHLGGCGGANGELKHQRAINTNPAIMQGVEAIMAIPAVAKATSVSFDAALAARVVENAGRTADILEGLGWNGATYVEDAVAKNPAGVEDLEVDHKDEKYHGHREAALVLVVGDKTLAVDDVFVWNLQASIEVARALAGDRGEEGYIQALIAEIAKHVAVADDLPSITTPLIVVTAH
jgi:hypothetical protein